MLLLIVKGPKKSCIRKETSRMERVQMSYNSEYAIASKMYGGNVAYGTWHRAPFDVLVKKKRIAIEVKTIHINSKDKKISMDAPERKRKMDFCKKWKATPKTLMCILDDTGPKPFLDVYERDGVGAFRINNMKYVGRIAYPKKIPRRLPHLGDDPFKSVTFLLIKRG